MQMTNVSFAGDMNHVGDLQDHNLNQMELQLKNDIISKHESQLHDQKRQIREL